MSGGSAAPIGIGTLGQFTGQALPRLDDVLGAYDHEERGDLLYNLCSALVREKFGTIETWNACGGQCLAFAKLALMQSIGEDGCNLLKRNVEYRLQITDALDPYAQSGPMPSGRLLLAVECSGCGYLKIGPAIDALESETKGLGAAFYWALLHAAYRVMHIYDHQDAMQYEEQMRDWAAEEEDATLQYEFPEIEKDLPEPIRAGARGERSVRAERRLLSQARRGRYKLWFECLRRLECLSRLRVPCERDDELRDNYDSRPLPSLLIAFQERDAITACFDEEGQHMLEGCPEPALLVSFDPTNEMEVHHAVRATARFVRFNTELFALIEELVRWEKDDGRGCLNRTELPLRTA